MIKNVRFSVQETDYNTTTWIVFNFALDNAAPYGWNVGCLGVNVLDANGNPFVMQCSWGTAGPLRLELYGGISWEDHLSQIATPGTYYFYLIICYLETIQWCNGSTTDWEHIAGPIQVNIH
jgi:hypothetical protein